MRCSIRGLCATRYIDALCATHMDKLRLQEGLACAHAGIGFGAVLR